MARLITLGMVILLISCTSSGYLSLGELVTSNQSSLSHISIGMNKSTILNLMKSSAAKTGDGIVNNPWLTEAFIGKDGSQYEVLHYITRNNQPFTPIRKSLATKVVFKDGKVVGWGENADEQYKSP